MTKEQFTQLVWEIRCCGILILICQMLYFNLIIKLIRK